MTRWLVAILAATGVASVLAQRPPARGPAAPPPTAFDVMTP